MNIFKRESNIISYTIDKTFNTNFSISICDGQVAVSVPWYASRKQINQVIEEKKKIEDLQNKHFLCQEFASEPGKDVRVYVVGNRIVKAMLRTNENDFKSNYSLGGKVAEYELNPEEEALVNKVIGGLNIGLAGIDFVFHQGMLYFNEIEDVVGARMLYANTDIDIVAEYVSYLVKNSVKIVKI